MVRVNARFFDEHEMIKHIVKTAKKSSGTIQYIKNSGIMPMSDRDVPQNNLKTGRLLRNKDAADNLLFHSRKTDEKEAAIYAWNHPEKLKFVRLSPLGENKGDSDEDRKNIRKKRKRGVVGYNQYEFAYNKKKYLIKLEVRKKGFEVPYHLERKRT